MQIDRQQLVRLREQRGWRSTDLAASAGLSRSFMSQVESGSREPSEVVVKRLAETLEVSVDDLTGGGLRCHCCGQPLPPNW